VCALGFLVTALGAGNGLAADWWGKSSGSKDKEQKRYQAQMRTQLNAFDPQFLLAMEKDLNLSDDQIDKLEDMVDNSRQDAKEVLTKEQVKELDRQVGTDTFTLNKLYDKVGGSSEGSSGMGRRTADSQDDVAMCRGLSGASMRHCQALASAKVSSYDPQFLVAYGRDLNLSDKQLQRLHAIIQDDRQQARKLLSREQRNQVEQFSRSPETMSDVQRDGQGGSRFEERGSERNQDRYGRQYDRDQDQDNGFRRTRVVDQSGGMGGGAQGSIGADQPMMMRYRGMMQSQIDPFDPQFVLALKQDLNLTDAQVQRLQSFIDSQRDSVKKVLSSEQTQKLSQLEQTPDSMVQMQREMMEQLCKGAGASGGSSGGQSGNGQIGGPNGSRNNMRNGNGNSYR